MFDTRTYIESVKKRLLANRLITDSGCWLWSGSWRGQGYGSISFLGKTYSVHKVSMQVFKLLEFKRDLNVLHKCDVKLCFNPEHLYCGTVSTNLYDAYERGQKIAPNLNKTHCPHGHEYTLDNTYYNKFGGRSCKICVKARSKAERKGIANI